MSATSASSRRYENCRAWSSSCGPMPSTARRPARGWAPSSGRPIRWARTWSMLVPDRMAPAGSQRCTGEQVAGLRAVDVSLLCLFVVETADDEQLFLVSLQRLEHLAQLHGSAGTSGPPFLAVEAVSREEAGESQRGLARSALGSPARHPRPVPIRARAEPSRPPGRAASPARESAYLGRSGPLFMVSLLAGVTRTAAAPAARPVPGEAETAGSGSMVMIAV